MATHLLEKKTTGIVSPLLLVRPEMTVQPFSFGKELTPLRLITRKTVPTEQELLNRIAPNYTTVDWVAGAVMGFRRELFKKLQGFDENIFLYFEDNDICKRAADLGFDNVVLHWSPVVHVGHTGEHGKTTKTTNTKHKKWYFASQSYYLKKHYSMVQYITIWPLQKIAHLLGKRK